MLLIVLDWKKQSLGSVLRSNLQSVTSAEIEDQWLVLYLGLTAVGDVCRSDHRKQRLQRHRH
jgi:hypothetical protein